MKACLVCSAKTAQMNRDKEQWNLSVPKFYIQYLFTLSKDGKSHWQGKDKLQKKRGRN